MSPRAPPQGSIRGSPEPATRPSPPFIWLMTQAAGIPSPDTQALPTVPRRVPSCLLFTLGTKSRCLALRRGRSRDAHEERNTKSTKLQAATHALIGGRRTSSEFCNCSDRRKLRSRIAATLVRRSPRALRRASPRAGTASLNPLRSRIERHSVLVRMQSVGVAASAHLCPRRGGEEIRRHTVRDRLEALHRASPATHRNNAQEVCDRTVTGRSEYPHSRPTVLAGPRFLSMRTTICSLPGKRSLRTPTR
jgi:hypothetical protein